MASDTVHRPSRETLQFVPIFVSFRRWKFSWNWNTSPRVSEPKNNPGLLPGQRLRRSVLPQVVNIEHEGS